MAGLGLGLFVLLGWAGVAQPDNPRVELGVVLPMLRLSEHEGTDIGLGGRLTYNVTNHIALDGELSLFSRELVRTPATPTVPMSTDRRVHGLFGIKAGTRWQSFGLFGKARPGFVNLQNKLHVVCVAEPCLPISSSETEVAFDLGAVIEFYPFRRLAIRIDVGDLWIGGTGNNIFDHDNSGVTGDLGHNFQWITGASIRF